MSLAGAGALAAVVVVATLIGGMAQRPVDRPGGGSDGRGRLLVTGPDPGGGCPARSRRGTRRRALRAILDGLQADCDYAWVGDDYDHREFHSALEVTTDGYRSSGLFGLNGGLGEWPEIGVQPFDDDSIYVQDWNRQGGTQERYRLLNADGTTTDLTMLPSTAPPAAGPDVVRTTFSSGGLARVDEAAGTIQRLDLPDAVFVGGGLGGRRAVVGSRRGLRRVLAGASGRLRHRELECNVHADQDPLMIDDDEPRATSWFTASGWPSSSWAAASSSPWRCM